MDKADAVAEALAELRYELDELRTELDGKAASGTLAGRIESLIVVATEAVEALAAQDGATVRRRWMLVDVD